MKQDQQANHSVDSILEPDFAGTDAPKVKQEIQNDLQAGIGAMTSREAGAMRDEEAPNTME